MAESPGPYNVLALLEAIGVELGLEWDNSLESLVPREIDAHGLAVWIAEHGEKIAQDIRHRSTRDRRRCIGGPFDGQRYTAPAMIPLVDGDRTLSYGRIALQIARGSWAAYAMAFDGRAFFVGIEGSERKAKALAATFAVPA